MEPASVDFCITDEVRALGVRGAFAHVAGADNRVYHPGFENFRAALAARLGEQLHADFVAADPVLAGFRALHERIGRSNRRYPSSAEALVGLFQRRRLIPRISPLVDVYNCVSLETRLSLGAHDLANVAGGIRLRMSDPADRFVPLGKHAPEALAAGEYCYADECEVLCRMEVRQCEKSKLTAATHDCFYILQGNRATGRRMLEAALERLIALTRDYCGGRLVRHWVSDE
jgi:DNA/RNA-binding domain of Phe-tRNA-synthetase-like protein